jgi:sugar/nucleoside kinase (ribokinase family)
VFRGTDEASYESLLSSAEVDPTGAGDVFLAALMVAWLVTGEPATADALRFASAAGSCAVERVGLAGVPTREEVAVRLGEATARPQARPDGASPTGSGT